MRDAILSLLWAKIGQADYSGRHPLPCHLIDVAMVVLRLWDQVLSGGFRKRIAMALQSDQDTAGRWMAFWAGAHDIGKAAPCFQDKDRSGGAKAELSAQGFDFPQLGDRPHGTISTAVLACELAGEQPWGGLERTFARRLAISVGGHHGVFPATGSWDFGADILGNEVWAQARCELLSRLASALGIEDRHRPQSPPENAHWFFMALAGMTSVGDWIGSNRQFFRPRPDVTDFAAYAVESQKAAKDALDHLGWTGWNPKSSAPRSFAALFPFHPRGVQRAVIELADRPDSRGLVLIEAPMGEGKTEAALYLADHWTHGFGQRGMYVALPTMATSNQMFSRVCEFLRHRYPSDTVNCHLLHGWSLLSDDYARMQEEAMQRHDAEVRRQEFGVQGIYGNEGAVVAESWFAQNKKQSLLAPFGVGTVDQVLLAVLQTKHVFVRLFGLAGKTIILDEIHAYDTYMSALLGRLLEWLAALGCSVVLLSATLPKKRRNALIRAWTGENQPDGVAPYPRVTMACDSGLIQQQVEVAPDRQTILALQWRDPQRLTTDLIEILHDGGCAVIIRNTVAKAQETYIAVRDALQSHDCEVDLFHSRFPLGRRQEIEQSVLRRYGKRAGDRPKRAVLVATQVVEQSLDLDFDLMVSDVAPIDLLLQRAGRLHRHRRARPVSLSSPVLWLLEPAATDGDPSFGPDEFVYEPYVLLRSLLVVQSRTEIAIPQDVENLIEAVYGDEDNILDTPLDERWRTVLAESRTGMERRRNADNAVARGVVIESARFEDDLLEVFNLQLDEENPEAHRTVQAATRLTEPSVSVVLLHRTMGTLSLVPNGAPLSLDDAPSLTTAKRVLSNAVALQHRRCVSHFLQTPPPEMWRTSPLLRFCRVAELDESGCYRMDGVILRYDRDLGVVIERGPEGG